MLKDLDKEQGAKKAKGHLQFLVDNAFINGTLME
jgi:hypothetical protein